MIPSLGRIVHYRLGTTDAEQINRRRTSSQSIHQRRSEPDGLYRWHDGAQAHIGNPVHAGDIFPAMIVRLWTAGQPATPSTLVQLQVFLDGNDTYWATRVSQLQPELGDQWPCWFEPPQVQANDPGPLTSGSGFTAGDMCEAAAQGFRDGQKAQMVHGGVGGDRDVPVSANPDHRYMADWLESLAQDIRRGAYDANQVVLLLCHSSYTHGPITMGYGFADMPDDGGQAIADQLQQAIDSLRAPVQGELPV